MTTRFEADGEAFPLRSLKLSRGANIEEVDGTTGIVIVRLPDNAYISFTAERGAPFSIRDRPSKIRGKAVVYKGKSSNNIVFSVSESSTDAADGQAGRILKGKRGKPLGRIVYLGTDL